MYNKNILAPLATFIPKVRNVRSTHINAFLTKTFAFAFSIPIPKQNKRSHRSWRNISIRQRRRLKTRKK
jgi:hypothetical protein